MPATVTAPARAAGTSSLLFRLFVEQRTQHRADQVLQYKGRLGVMDDIAIAQDVLRATDGDTDVFLAQYTGGLDRCDAVLGNVIDIVVDMQFHPCAHADRVEVNAGD